MSKEPDSIAQYKGPLDTESAVKGMQTAAIAAHDLHAAAKLLLGNGCFAQSSVLALLAIEETEKIYIIREIFLARPPAEVAKRWREYRAHKAKLTAFMGAELTFLAHQKAGRVDRKTVQSLQKDIQQGRKVLDFTKQTLLYSDCLEQVKEGKRTGPKWSLPRARASREQATKLLEKADYAIGGSVRQIESPEELEIWKKYTPELNSNNPGRVKSALARMSEEFKKRNIQPKALFRATVELAELESES